MDAKKDVLTTPEEMRPIAIHVESISDDFSLQHIYRKRVAVIDLECSHENAAKLIKILEQKLSKERGSIRIRVKGRMVLE